MRNRDYRIAGQDLEGGLAFEPRGFWSVRAASVHEGIDVTDVDPDVIRFDREHFRNGARWPIMLTRLALAPINYTLQQYAPTDPVPLGNYHNDCAALNLMEVLVTSPQRRGWSKNFRVSTGSQIRPTAEPGMRLSSTPTSSGPWGVCRMDLDKPLILPQHGAIEIGTGAPSSSDAIPVADQVGPLVWISAEERGGLWGGNNRVFEPPASVGLRDLSASQGPYSSDLFLSTQGTGAGGPIIDLVNGTMRAEPFIKQGTARGRSGSNRFDAINIHINQIEYDDSFQNSLDPAVVAAPVTPLSLRMPCSARTRAGGTGQYWWRSNAPIALMFNDITPAIVYDFPDPITLGPGDALDVAFRYPWVHTIGEDVTQARYQLGVALTGYAVIEG